MEEDLVRVDCVVTKNKSRKTSLSTFLAIPFPRSWNDNLFDLTKRFKKRFHSLPSTFYLNTRRDFTAAYEKSQSYSRNIKLGTAWIPLRQFSPSLWKRIMSYSPSLARHESSSHQDTPFGFLQGRGRLLERLCIERKRTAGSPNL